MTTELQTTAAPTLGPITFNVPREAIALLADQLLPLTIKGVRDKRGLAVVQKGREELLQLERKIERRRKELTAPLHEQLREVNDVAGQLQGLIAPIAGHLRSEVERVTAERTKLERQTAGNRAETIRLRVSSLAAVGHEYTPADVAHLSDDEYLAMLERARANPKPTAPPAVRPGPQPLDFPNASVATDHAKLMHVANRVALIDVPAVATKAGAAVAEEIEALLSSCSEKIRAAANSLER